MDRPQSASHRDQDFPTSLLISSVHSEVSQKHPIIRPWGLKHKEIIPLLQWLSNHIK